MVTTIITLIYLSGIPFAYASVLQASFNREKSRAVMTPEGGLEHFKTNWYVDFDEEWDDIIKARWWVYRQCLWVAIGSWLVLLAMIKDEEKPGFRWRLPRMPDKEEFRLVVTSQRLIDHEWSNADVDRIREIRNERRQTKDN